MRRLIVDKYDLEEMFEEATDEWGEWKPIEFWPTELLVDLEILCNGELQRRAGS